MLLWKQPCGSFPRNAAICKEERRGRVCSARRRSDRSGNDCGIRGIKISPPSTGGLSAARLTGGLNPSGPSGHLPYGGEVFLFHKRESFFFRDDPVARCESQRLLQVFRIRHVVRIVGIAA